MLLLLQSVQCRAQYWPMRSSLPERQSSTCMKAVWGAYLGVTSEDEFAATHRFAADIPGYRGWQWAVVVAAGPEDTHATISELALLPGPDALVAPEWLPWDQRIRPGDLSVGDLLAPPAEDPRLVPGYVAHR